MFRQMIPREMQKILVLGVGIFLAMLFWGGRWMYGNSVSNLLKIKEERRRVVLENKVGAKLGELKKIRDNMRVVKESSRFLAEIAKMTGKFNLKLVSITALPIEKYEEFIKLTVQLEIDTSYHELGVFISELENCDLFIRINRLDISVPEGTIKTTSRINARLSLSTLYLTDIFLEK
ncbi:MAG: type 4a pilus biogenesis protein PilO [Candidatus Omnitrophota bacterium]